MAGATGGVLAERRGVPRVLFGSGVRPAAAAVGAARLGPAGGRLGVTCGTGVWAVGWGVTGGGELAVGGVAWLLGVLSLLSAILVERGLG